MLKSVKVARIRLWLIRNEPSEVAAMGGFIIVRGNDFGSIGEKAEGAATEKAEAAAEKVHELCAAVHWDSGVAGVYD